ncbi:hypothetical protein Bbelb_282450 [Branchiostoma belcheri]|nr:hypothetical protein Bbelb_282450 [Branchiostoma belcheri]
MGSSCGVNDLKAHRCLRGQVFMLLIITAFTEISAGWGNCSGTCTCSAIQKEEDRCCRSRSGQEKHRDSQAEKASFEIKVTVTVQDVEGEAEEGDLMVEEHQYSPAAASSNDAVVLFPLKNGDEIAHVVQDLPFEEKVLKLSSGESVKVPNTIRAMIPERIISQYQQYCTESHFVPMGKRILLRVLDASLEVFEGGNNTKQAKEKANRKVGNYIVKRCSKALHTARQDHPDSDTEYFHEVDRLRLLIAYQGKIPNSIPVTQTAAAPRQRYQEEGIWHQAEQTAMPFRPCTQVYAAVLADSIGPGTTIRRANDLLGASHPRTVPAQLRLLP